MLQLVERLNLVLAAPQQHDTLEYALCDVPATHLVHRHKLEDSPIGKGETHAHGIYKTPQGNCRAGTVRVVVKTAKGGGP